MTLKPKPRWPITCSMPPHEWAMWMFRFLGDKWRLHGPLGDDNRFELTEIKGN